MFLRRMAIGAAVGTGLGPLLEKPVNDIRAGKHLDDFVDDAQEIFERGALEKEIAELQKDIKDTYGIDAEVDEAKLEESGGRYNGFIELRLLRKRDALKDLAYGLSLYPRIIIAQSGLKTINVTARTTDSKNVAGYALDGNLEATEKKYQPKITLAYTHQWEHATSNRGIVGPKNERERRRQEQLHTFLEVLDHELCHYFIDTSGSEDTPRFEEAILSEQWEETFGQYNAAARERHKDTAWTGRYNTMTGEKELDYNQVYETTGFARGYGMKTSEEDRATTVELLAKEGAISFKYEDDPILSKKLDLMRDFYFKLSKGLMDNKYWDMRSMVRAMLNGPHYRDSNHRSKPMTNYLKEQAGKIISTPYESFDGKKLVSKETYAVWQTQLKAEYQL